MKSTSIRKIISFGLTCAMVLGLSACDNSSSSTSGTGDASGTPDASLADTASADASGDVSGYTAKTAPIVLLNNCAGWNSSTPGDVDSRFIEAGMVFINCGARSRDDGANGKMPTPVIDLKSCVRMLRLNDDVIPGNCDNIISLGGSGAGQMSSILGASGNMEEYYPYLYENKAPGIEKDGDEYVSTIDDNIYASMCYCPIADLENADLAYAWSRYDVGDTDFIPMFGEGATFTEFQLELQNDLAVAFCEYINTLNLVNEDGEALNFDTDEDGNIISPRQGSFYDQILENISDALNAFAKNQTFPYEITVGFGPDAVTNTYESFDDFKSKTMTDTDKWLTQDEDGTYHVTDLAGFYNGTSLARNKNIPGFDTFWATEEGNGFGTSSEDAVHFSKSVAAVLKKNYDKYKELDGFDACDVDDYIEQTSREDIANQTALMNATHLLLDVAAGDKNADIAKFWRTRNGTADEHTSFSIAYNLCRAAEAAGAEADYSLVYNMPHGDDEGETTGTLIDWINDIVK